MSIDDGNLAELAREKRMHGAYAPINAFEIVRNNREWYCPRCQAFVSGEAVTHEETHVVCGTTVTSDDTVVTLAQEITRVTTELTAAYERGRKDGYAEGYRAELAAIKARTCEMCTYSHPMDTGNYIVYICSFWGEGAIHALADQGCSNYEPKEAADAP